MSKFKIPERQGTSLAKCTEHCTTAPSSRTTLAAAPILYYPMSPSLSAAPHFISVLSSSNYPSRDSPRAPTYILPGVITLPSSPWVITGQAVINGPQKRPADQPDRSHSLGGRPHCSS